MPSKDPEKRRQQARERYRKNPEKYRRAHSCWRANNPERSAEIDARYRKGKPYASLSEEQKQKLRDKVRRARARHYTSYLLKRLRKKAEQIGVPFNLKEDDLSIPQSCPVLGIQLDVAGRGQRDGAPSVDRLVPARGYVQGNVRVISMKANRIKNDATVEELLAVVAYMRGHHG